MPYHSIPDGKGGWVPMAQRVQELQDPATKALAEQLYLTDQFLPGKCEISCTEMPA